MQNRTGRRRLPKTPYPPLFASLINPIAIWDLFSWKFIAFACVLPPHINPWKHLPTNDNRDHRKTIIHKYIFLFFWQKGTPCWDLSRKQSSYHTCLEICTIFPSAYFLLNHTFCWSKKVQSAEIFRATISNLYHAMIFRENISELTSSHHTYLEIGVIFQAFFGFILSVFFFFHYTNVFPTSSSYACLEIRALFFFYQAFLRNLGGGFLVFFLFFFFTQMFLRLLPRTKSHAKTAQSWRRSRWARTCLWWERQRWRQRLTEIYKVKHWIRNMQIILGVIFY
jgi:hypothetical protein